jgi:hypothetical protein
MRTVAVGGDACDGAGVLADVGLVEGSVGAGGVGEDCAAGCAASCCGEDWSATADEAMVAAAARSLMEDMAHIVTINHWLRRLKEADAKSVDAQR